MVTGGYNEIISNTNSKFKPLDTTEIFSNNVWKTVAGRLPSSIWSQKVATINNRVLCFGNSKFVMISWWKMPVRTFSYTWVWKLVSRDGFSGFVFLAFVS